MQVQGFPEVFTLLFVELISARQLPGAAINPIQWELIAWIGSLVMSLIAILWNLYHGEKITPEEAAVSLKDILDDLIADDDLSREDRGKVAEGVIEGAQATVKGDAEVLKKTCNLLIGKFAKQKLDAETDDQKQRIQDISDGVAKAWTPG